MKLLLDTHAFLWWDADAAKLSPNAYRACYNRSNTVFLSLVSIWEIQIKVQIGKLRLRLPSLRDVLDEHKRDSLRLLMPTEEDVLGLAVLPMLHRDPFDRLLVSQAQRGGFQLVPRDPLIGNYGVATLWQKSAVSLQAASTRRASFSSL